MKKLAKAIFLGCFSGFLVLVLHPDAPAVALSTMLIISNIYLVADS